MDTKQSLRLIWNQICLLKNKISSALTIKTNSVNNADQSVLNLIDSATVQFVYTVDGKVTANSSAGGSAGVIYGEFEDNAAALAGGVPIGALYQLPVLSGFYPIAICKA